jgi:hypothetical protein
MKYSLAYKYATSTASTIENMVTPIDDDTSNGEQRSQGRMAMKKAPLKS